MAGTLIVRGSRARGRAALALSATVAAASAGCAAGLGEAKCVSEPPPSIAFVGPVRDAVTAGVAYFQELRAVAGSLLGPTYGIEAIQLPGGATVSSSGLSWLPPAALAGTVQRFRVRSNADPCGNAAELSWSVYVHPPIEIGAFEAVPAVVSSRGAPVRLLAEYAGGEGRIVAPFSAAIASGVPLEAGVVGATTEFRLAVTSPAGDALERSATVVAQSPPSFTATSFYPPLAAAGDGVVLSWSLAGTVTSLTFDPGGIALDPYASFREVPGEPGVAYTLTARNDAGDVATATISPVVLPRPVVSSFTASPPSPAYLGTTAVTAVFDGGDGVLRTPDAPLGFPISSGVPVEVGPLHRNAQLSLEVSNPVALAQAFLLVGLSGPGTWELLPEGPGAHLYDHTATRLADGRVLIAGGHFASGGAVLETTIWDPASGASTPGPTLRHVREGHAAALLSDGRVLLAGGQGIAGAPVDEAELLDVVAGTSVAAGSVGDAGWHPQLVALPDGSAVLHSASLYWTRAILRLDPDTSTLSPLTTVAGLGWVRSFALADGRVLMLSGGQYDLTPSWILDPATGDLSPTGSTLRVMGEFEGVALADGRILVVDRESPAQVYDPAGGAFAWTGAPVVTGRLPRGVLLANGEVLFSGATSMRYDPVAGAFRETGGMFEDGTQPLVLLPDGTVLAPGSWTERYRP